MSRYSLLACVALAGAVTAASAFGALAQPSRWDFAGGRADDRRAYDLRGPGVDILVPELRNTRRGQAFVLRNFDADRNGRINRREALAANDAFAAVAGQDRRNFRWERFDEPARAERRWDREGMRAYRFRQGRYGATFDIGDVLFEVDSVRLRPGAARRLDALAGYLAAERGVQVRIDGHTDSTASDAYNLQLSRARAQSVAEALAAAGVEPRRLRVEGFGERQPVADNATAQGRQRNRRVEITLVGRRADEFR